MPKGKFLLFLIFFIYILIVFFSYSTKSKTDESLSIPNDHPSSQIPIAVPQPLSKPLVSPAPDDSDRKAFPGQILKKTQMLRGVAVVEHIFYRDGQEIAHQTIDKDGQVTQSGSVPDGPVKIFDSQTQSYGEENYLGGKRYGPARLFYSNGQLRSETSYHLEKIERQKEYYPDGKLRFEVDYSDARNYPGDKEVGIGKLYNPNGSLKYEWNITKNQSEGYKKSYNSDGSLRAVYYFDENGKRVGP